MEPSGPKVQVQSHLNPARVVSIVPYSPATKVQPGGRENGIQAQRNMVMVREVHRRQKLLFLMRSRGRGQMSYAE